MSTRRNALIRTVAAVAGDIAIGVAMASACVWIIEAAALGLFLSFLLWLLTVILSLALSQCVLHPAVKLVLSDRKLDDAVHVITAMAAVADVAGSQVVESVARCLQSAYGALPARLRPA